MGTSVQHPLCFLGRSMKIAHSTALSAAVLASTCLEHACAAGAASALRLGYFDRPSKFVL